MVGGQQCDGLDATDTQPTPCPLSSEDQWLLQWLEDQEEGTAPPVATPESTDPAAVQHRATATPQIPKQARIELTEVDGETVAKLVVQRQQASDGAATVGGNQFQGGVETAQGQQGSNSATIEECFLSMGALRGLQRLVKDSTIDHGNPDPIADGHLGTADGDLCTAARGDFLAAPRSSNGTSSSSSSCASVHEYGDESAATAAAAAAHVPESIDPTMQYLSAPACNEGRSAHTTGVAAAGDDKHTGEGVAGEQGSEADALWASTMVEHVLAMRRRGGRGAWDDGVHYHLHVSSWHFGY